MLRSEHCLDGLLHRRCGRVVDIRALLVDSNILKLSSTDDCMPVLWSERQGTLLFGFTCHIHVSLDSVIIMSCVHHVLELTHS